jgi:hypothetical protein
MNDPEYRMIDIGSLRVEDGVSDLLNSPDMQPYSRYIEAAVTGADIGSSVQEIAALPLERRYVWRVASALRWAFVDLEEWNVAADRQTLAPEDAQSFWISCDFGRSSSACF